MASRPWDYSRSETVADGLVHLGGVALAVAGAFSIVVVALSVADASSAVAVGVYAITLVAALVASAAYSMWPVGPAKWRLRKYDHATIYLLIAGTYTPFAAAMGEGGTWLLAGTWLVALTGAVLALAFPGRVKPFSVGLYLGLAWSGILIVDTLLESFPKQVFGLLLAGGLIYSAGVPFHLWKKLKFHKAIWHAFVLVAATLHYKAIFLLVLMQDA